MYVLLTHHSTDVYVKYHYHHYHHHDYHDYHHICYIGSNSWKNRRLGTVGIALPQVKLRIVDPATLEELPADTDGEVGTHSRVE